MISRLPPHIQSLKDSSRFSPPHTSIPESYSPSSWKYNRSIAKRPKSCDQIQRWLIVQISTLVWLIMKTNIVISNNLFRHKKMFFTNQIFQITTLFSNKNKLSVIITHYQRQSKKKKISELGFSNIRWKDNKPRLKKNVTSCHSGRFERFGKISITLQLWSWNRIPFEIQTPVETTANQRAWWVLKCICIDYVNNWSYYTSFVAFNSWQ